MRISPKAIIFDYGNVLTEPQNEAGIQAMASILGLEAAEFEKLYWRFRIVYDEGKLAPREYWTMVAEAAARALSPPQIEKLTELDTLSWMCPRRIICDWARRLRNSGFRIALLSNMPVPLRDALLKCDWLPAFHQRTFSCDLHRSKPDRGIYLHCLRGLGMEAPEALFVDDRESNVLAAAALGMHALQFTTPAALARDIERSFHIPIPLVGTLESTHAQDG